VNRFGALHQIVKMLIVLTHGYCLQDHVDRKGIEDSSNVAFPFDETSSHQSSSKQFRDFLEQDQYQKILDYFLESEERYENPSSNGHLNIGLTQLLLKKYSSALIEFRSVLQKDSDDDISKSLFLTEIATTHLMQGNNTDALKMNYTALDSCYPKQTRSLVTDLGILQYCGIRNENGRESLKGTSKGYTIQDNGEMIDDGTEMKSGKLRIEVITRALNNIAVVYVELGKLSAAYATLEEAKNILVGRLEGKEKAKYTRCRAQLAVIACNMAYILIRQGKNIEAINLFEEAGFLVETIFGKTHTLNLQVMDQLGFAYARTNTFYDDSVSCFSKLVELEKEKGLSWFSTLNKLAYVQIKQNKITDALKNLEEVLEFQKKVPFKTPSHEEQINGTQNLITVLEYERSLREREDTDELIVDFRRELSKKGSNNLMLDPKDIVDAALQAPVQQCIVDTLLLGPIDGLGMNARDSKFITCRSVNDGSLVDEKSTIDTTPTIQKKAPAISSFYSQSGMELNVFTGGLETNDLESLSKSEQSNIQEYAAKARGFFCDQKFQLAMANFQLAIELLEQNDLAKNNFYLSSVLQDLGLCQIALGMYDGALKTIHRALQLRKGLGAEEGQLLAKLAVALYEAGETRAATIHFHDALDIATRYEMPVLMSSLYSNIATALINENKWEESSTYLEECLIIQNSILEQTSPQILHTMTRIAFVSQKREKNMDALNIYATLMRRLKVDFVNNKAFCVQIVELMNKIYIKKGLLDAATDNSKSLLRYFETHSPNDLKTIIELESKISAMEKRHSKLVFV